MERKLAKLVIIICSVFLFLTVLKSFYFSNKTGGGDLRSRIVSSRMLFTGMSPYFYRWQPGDNEFYLDPNNHFDWPVNTNVSTPAALLAIYPVSILPYRMVRFLWTTLELVAAALTLILVCRSLKNKEMVWCFLIAVGLVASDIWMYHSERGQKYIFYACFLSVIYYLTKKGTKNAEWAAGLLSGLFVFFRPFMAVLVIAWVLGRKWQLFKGWAVGIILGVLLFVIPFLHLWTEYYSSMHLWVSMYLDQNVLLPTFKTFAIPETIEGMKNLNIYTGFNIESLGAIPQYINEWGFKFSDWMSFLFFMIPGGVAGLLFLKGHRKNLSIERIFILGFLLYDLATISFPAPRNGYCLVQWLFALPILVFGFRRNKGILVILFSAMLLLHNFPFFFPYQALIAEIIFIFYSFLYLYRPLQEDETDMISTENSVA